MADGLEIPISTPGFEKLGELKDQIKTLKKELLGLSVTSKDFADKSAILGAKQTIANKAMSMGWSEQAKLKDAYFKTGLEVRQLILGSGLLGKDMGRLGDVMGAGVINALQLRRALAPLGITMGGVGIALVALTSLMPTIIDQFKTATRTVDDFKKSLEDLTISQLNQQLVLLELWQKEATTKKGGRGSGIGLLINSIFGDDPAVIAEKIKLVQESLAKLNREVEKSAAAALAGVAEARAAGERGVSGFVTRKKAMTLAERLGAGANRQIGLANLAAPLPFSFKEAKTEASEFSQHMKSGFMSATGQLTQGFVQAFGLANNLAGQLLATLIAAASQALIIMGLRALGNFIAPGLGSTIFGAGGSAAPSGSPVPVLSAQRSGGGGVMPIPFIAEARWKGGDVVFGFKRAENVANNRSFDVRKR